MGATVQRPESDIDLWTTEALLDPYELWREPRDLGPAVWMPKHQIWALPRYGEVREALHDWRRFSSASGVTLNERMNGILAGGTLCSDPPAHDALRRAVRQPLVPKELKALEPEIQAEADALVQRLVARESFDAVTDLAQHLRQAIVSASVGLPDEGRENMLEWAAANFDCFGPMNERAQAAFPKLEEGVRFSFDPSLPGRLKPGGWAARLWEAAERGEIAADHARRSSTTTGGRASTRRSSTASAVWLFGQFPDQWDLLREDRSLIAHAINEVVRLESPIPQFSRLTTCACDVGPVTIPEGSRVLMMYGSANRDERKWEDPERFDIRRRRNDHLGFGHEEHQCLGQPLARMEIKALLNALADRVGRFELGTMERAVNNMLRGIRTLRVTVRLAPARTRRPRGW